MQSRPFSNIYNQFKLWLPFTVLTLWFVTTSITPAAASVDITQIPQGYHGFAVSFLPLPDGFGYSDPNWWYAFTTTQSTFDLCQDGTFNGDLFCNVNKLVFTGKITGAWSSFSIHYIGGVAVGYSLTYALSGYGWWNDIDHQFNTFKVTTYAPETEDKLSGNLVLFATPEPSSLVLIGSGALGLAGILRRKINL